MKLHRSLLIFASSRALVSPVQRALLPGSSRIDGFYVLIIGLPQGREKEERLRLSISESVSEWSYEQNTSQAYNPEYPILDR